MSVRMGYKPCIDCKVQIKKRGARKRCPKCQLAHEIELDKAARLTKRKPARIVACNRCQGEFVARGSNHKTCDKCHQARARTYQPTRAKKEPVTALPLAALSGDKFARAVNAFLRATNG